MAKKLNKLDLLKLPSIGTPNSDSVAFAAKSDGLYQKIGSSEEKLLTTNESSYIPLVIGTQTATTASWTGVLDADSLESGQTIRYWLPRTSASGVTLNLTLKGGGTTGAINCYVRGTTRLTTHYPAGSYINMTYLKGALINGTAYTGWWAQTYYADGTESYTVRWNAAIKAGAQITRYKLLVQGSDGRYYPTTVGNTTAGTKTISTVPFLIGSPIIFYSRTTTVAAGGVTSASYNYTGITTTNTTYAWNKNSGWRANEDVYLKGTVSGALFTLDNTTLTSHMTQDLPTTEDGFYYMRLGMFTTTTTGFRLSNQHPTYYFADGELQSLNTSHGADWDELINKPSTFAPSAHNHDATHLTSGIVPVARLGTNTGTSALYLRGDNQWVTPPNTKYSVATTSANGLMSSGDKTKLDGIATKANNYVHPASHPISFITGLQSALNGKLNLTGGTVSGEIIRSTTSSLTSNIIQIVRTTNAGVAPVRMTLKDYDIGIGLSNNGQLITGDWGSVGSLSSVWDVIYHTGNLSPVTTNTTQTITGGKTFSKLITANAGVSTTTITASGIITVGSQGNSNQWDTAYGWGNHADKNYLTSYVDTKYTAGTGLELLTSGGTNTFNVKLSDSISTTSSTTAATSSAVKSAYNRGSTGITNAATAQTKADSAYTLANGKEDKFTKNGAFNKNFGTTKETVAQGNDSRINNGQTAFGWGNHALKGYATETYVDNIDIGGRNLIIFNTLTPRYVNTNGSLASSSVVDGTDFIQVTPEENYIYTNNLPVPDNMYIGFYDENKLFTRRVTVPISERQEYHFKPNINEYFVRISNSALRRREESQLEKGTKATDWTPAPEDQVSDWSTTDVNSFSFIKNKPTLLSQFTDNIGVASHIANKANPHEVDVPQITGLNLDTLALGLGSVANETGSVALGEAAKVYGKNSLGIRGTVYGEFSTAINSWVEGFRSFGLGGDVYGDYSISIGGMVEADHSIAIGQSSYVEEPNTGVLGTNGANGYGANKWVIPGNLAIGKNTTATESLDVVGNIKASGTLTTPKVNFGNGFTLEASGTQLVMKYNGVIRQRFLADGSIASTNELSAHQ